MQPVGFRSTQVYMIHITSSAQLRKTFLSYSQSAFVGTLNLPNSHYYSLHLISYHFAFSSSSDLFDEVSASAMMQNAAIVNVIAHLIRPEK
jgi:hypothetical protein